MLLSPIYWWENWGIERLSKLSKVTQLIGHPLPLPSSLHFIIVIHSSLPLGIWDVSLIFGFKCLAQCLAHKPTNILMEVTRVACMSMVFSLLTFTPLRAEAWVPQSLQLLVAELTGWDRWLLAEERWAPSHPGAQRQGLSTPSLTIQLDSRQEANKAFSSLGRAGVKLADRCTKECLIMLSRYSVLVEPLWHSVLKKWQPSIAACNQGLASRWLPASRTLAFSGNKWHPGIRGNWWLHAKMSWRAL